MWRFDRKQQNSVKQLSFKRKKRKDNTKEKKTVQREHSIHIYKRSVFSWQNFIVGLFGFFFFFLVFGLF